MLKRVPKTKEGIPKKYLPKSLSPEDRKKQLKSIKEGTKRPKVDFRTKRSTHCEKFEKKYGYKISDLKRVEKEIISKEGIEQIKKKGIAAYYNGGSRPNQTPDSWWNGKLCSVIINRKAKKKKLKK